MKKLSGLILILSLLLGLLSGCREATSGSEGLSDKNPPSSGREQTNEIVVGIAQDLDDCLDPNLSTAAGTREVMFNVFEGLVKPDSTGEYRCAVASDYEIADGGLRYVFTLRDNVVFHDGSACTYEDILYSFEACADTTVNSTVAAALSAVSDYSGDDSSFVITLSQPNSDFLSILANVYILPKDYAGQATAPVGTGPFAFVSRSVQENIILSRFDGYYGTPAHLSKVTYKVFEDVNALFTALNSSSLDVVAHLTSDQIKNLSNGYTVLEGTMNLVQAMYLNHSFGPFSNELVRKALCYAVDVDAMMAFTAGGHGTKVGSSMYPAFAKYFDPALANAYPHDIEMAKELLSQAGYPNGFSFTITVPSNYTPHVNTAVVLAEQLKAVGITAELQQVDWNTWVEDVYGGRNFEATVVGFDASTLNAGSLLHRWVSDNGKNMINHNNPEYDSTFAAAQASIDDKEQTALYKRCLEILSETAANVYLQDLADFVAIHPDLTGYRFYPLYVMDMSTLQYGK